MHLQGKIFRRNIFQKLMESRHRFFLVSGIIYEIGERSLVKYIFCDVYWRIFTKGKRYCIRRARIKINDASVLFKIECCRKESFLNAINDNF